MKTAILLATRKGDALAVKFLRHDAFSKILADFKSRVAEDRGEPGYDGIQIWTGPPAKTASRLSSGGEEVILFSPGAAPTAEQYAEIDAEWTMEENRLNARIEELEEELAELKMKFQSADPQGLESEAQADGKASGESGSLSGGASLATEESELPLTDPDSKQGEASPGEASPGEASRGTMSPKKKAK